MAIKNAASADTKLLGIFLTPSWLSGLVSVVCGCLVIGGTIALMHVGTTTRQSILGLHDAYVSGSFGRSVGVVSDRLAQNTTLNNALLFLMWGSVGLVVYSVVQGFANEFKQADELVHELKGIPARSRQSILRAAIGRALIRLIAFVCWWLLVRYGVYHLLPQAITAAHGSALHLTDISDWARSVLAAGEIMLALHILTVLLRLTVFRPRIFDEDIIV